ncbi:MAG: cobalamin B12-binding domain-containing protein, partial [Elusimicrobiota bacterium]
MRTICLIIPPSVFLLDERVFMALGILKVAAVLEKTGHAVELLDLSGVENFEEVVTRHASSSKASVFGLTATTPQLPAAAKIVAALRRARPDARAILGGPHVTL